MAYLNGKICSSKIKGALMVLMVFFILLLIAFGIFSRSEQLKVERESFRLGTIVRLTAYGSDKKALDTALDDSMSEMTRLENLLSVNIISSDVSKINRAAGKNAVIVNAETEEVILKAVKWARESNGAFDPSIGRLVKLWGIGTSSAHIPEQDEINKIKNRVDYRHIELKPLSGGKYKVFAGEGQSLDLGGIAKGWIADRVAEVMKKNGVSSAIIDLGGNIVVIGKSPKGKQWKLGLQHPFKPRGEYFAVIDAEDISVVTSGPYERFFEAGGVRYHHIFDPATGYPAKSDLASVSVVGKSSADADALCTMLFVMGFDKSSAYLRKHNDIQSVLVVIEGDKAKAVITPGLERSFRLKDDRMSLEVLRQAWQ